MRKALPLTCVAVLLTGCSSNASVAELHSPRSRRGAELLHNYGCVTCHTIPGVRGADADVGPPLTRIARRSYLAGRIPNTPANMYRWIRDPKTVDPATAMPNTGVTEEDAGHIVSFLYTLR